MNRRPTPFSLSRHLTHLLVCIYILSPLAIPIVSLQAGDEIIDFDNRPFNEVTPYAPSNIRFDQKNRYLFHRDFGSYRFLQKDYRLFIDEAGSASSASLPDNGTDYARDLPTSTPITIVRIDGHPFELRSFDVAEYSSVIPQPVVVFITGVKSDHSEVTASFVSDGRFDGSGPMEDFETLMLPDGFVDLVRVDIETSGCHLDNFRLSGPDFLSRNTDYPARPIIFDLTWESDRFPENLPPETGGFDAPTLVFSLPLVLQSSSAFAGKSLFLQRGQHPAGWIAAENDDAEGFQIAHNANASSYHVAARLLIPHMSTSGEGEKLSISLTTSPYAVNLIFNSNGTISFSVNHHSDEETIGNFTFGKPLGIGIRVDRRSGMILIDKDGQTVHTESLGAPILDITETKVLLHSASGSSSSAEVADFRVTGNEIPLFYEARGPIPEVPVLQPSATPFLSADVGITVSRPIVIKNIGDEELRIDAIEFTSSSLQVKAELPLIISPGETGSITVSYTGEDPSLGRQYGDMYVYSNSDISPIRRSFEFLTRGHGRIAVLPQSVNRVMRANSQSVFTLGLAYYGINPSYSFNIQFPAEGQDLPVPTVPITPNDPLFSSQWHHRTPASGSAGIDTTRAWSVTRGSPLVVVAVVDTGVNFDHPDLQDARNHGNQGYDFLDDDNDPSDPSIDPFGTFVAGVIGATGNNGQGGAGVASNVKIMALRYIDADRGIGFASDAADCITYAANNGANVINNSWGSNNFSGAILLAIETALRKGITVVNSAGNRGLSNDVTPYYPASYVARSLAGTDDTIAVAASTENDNLNSNSSFGAVSVDVVAPGRNILGTWRNDTYDTDSGTGQSTAIVSGVAALLYSQDPLITPYDVKTAILSSVDKLASLEGRVASGGRVNAARALEQRAREWLSTPDGGASTLARGETAQAEFTIDTTGLAPGRYSKNIFFYETNTYGLSGEIPLTIDVIGDITDPPTILQQQSVAAEAETGKVTSLRIEALGEPIAYQWYRGSPGDMKWPRKTEPKAR